MCAINRPLHNNRFWPLKFIIGPNAHLHVSSCPPLSSFVWITHIVTQRESQHRIPSPSVFRSLVAATRIDAEIRCAVLRPVTMWVIHTSFASLRISRLADISPRHPLSSSHCPLCHSVRLRRILLPEEFPLFWNRNFGLVILSPFVILSGSEESRWPSARFFAAAQNDK